MRSEQLSGEQLEALYDRTSAMLAYLNRLEQRMEQRGFSRDDWLRIAVGEARAKMQVVCKALADLGAGGTMGRLPQRGDPLGRKPRKHRK